MHDKKSGKAFNTSLSVLLYFIDKDYRETHPEVLDHTNAAVWRKALEMARENGLLYCFLEKMSALSHANGTSTYPSGPIFESMIKNEKEKHRKFRDTLDFVNSTLSEERLEYLFIKLYRGITYTPRDVDVLIRKGQNKRVISAFEDNNASLRLYDDAEVNLEKKNLLKVDLYNGFYYFSRDFMDEDFLWSKSRKVDICGTECPIPSREADLASLLVHSILAHRYLSLLDFMYVCSLLSSDLEFNQVVQQAKRYKWENACFAMIDVIKRLRSDLYVNNRSASFPVMFPPNFVLRFFKLSAKRKLAFAASSLVDLAIHRYERLESSLNFEVPETIHITTLRVIRKVKHWVGDRKGMSEAPAAD